MAALGTTLMSKVLGHSEAEKAFRPWWDNLEDFMIYGLVMLGLIVIPTAMIMGTPLDCNYCQADHCGLNFINNASFPINMSSIRQDPKFSGWWVKKYCTLNGTVKHFMLYFPYLLLIVALVLVLIERFFLRIFKAGLKMERFYKLLLRENILVKDEDGKITDVAEDFTDGGREAIEVRQSFRRSSTYFMSYLGRTILEIIIAIGLIAWMSATGFAEIEHESTIHCNVHGYWFECSGSPQQFYLYILYIAVSMGAIYIFANLYNFMWLTIPCIGKLSKVMRTYKHNLIHNNSAGTSEAVLLGELYHIYYDNRDLRLLLDLLAASSGIAPAISIMTLFDKKFREATKPEILQVNISSDLGLARVEFQEPTTGVRAALSKTPGVHLVYVAEICPPADTAVEAFEFIPEKLTHKTGDMEMMNLKDVHVQPATFTGLKEDVEYTIKVSTVVNGMTISQVTRELRPSQHEKLPVDIHNQVSAREDDNLI